MSSYGSWTEVRLGAEFSFPPMVFNSSALKKMLLCHSRPFCKLPWQLSRSVWTSGEREKKQKCGIRTTADRYISVRVKRQIETKKSRKKVFMSVDNERSIRDIPFTQTSLRNSFISSAWSMPGYYPNFITKVFREIFGHLGLVFVQDGLQSSVRCKQDAPNHNLNSLSNWFQL